MMNWKRFTALTAALGLSLALSVPALADSSTLVPTRTVYTGQFADIKEASWSEVGVRICYEAGLLIGYTDTRFAPEDDLTRAQLAVACARFVAAYRGEELPSTVGSAWYRESVNYLLRNGLLSSWSDSTARKPITYRAFLEEMDRMLTACGITPPTLDLDDQILSNTLHNQGQDDLILNFYQTGILNSSDQFFTTHQESDIISRGAAAALLGRIVTAAGHA